MQEEVPRPQVAEDQATAVKPKVARGHSSQTDSLSPPTKELNKQDSVDAAHDEAPELHQLSKEELDEQLESVLYALGQLQQIMKRDLYISQREVAALRNALEFTLKEGKQYLSDPEKDSAPSPKAAAAIRMMESLERYVNATPTAGSYEGSAKYVSWSSIFHTPSERRKQSIMTAMFLFFTGIPISLFVSALLLCCRYTAPFMLAYIIYIFTLGKPKHPMPKMMNIVRHPIWRHYRNYFPVRLVIPRCVRRQFDKTKNYFFVYHPHGIHTFGAILCFGLDTNDSSRMLPGIRTHAQTLGINYYIPFWGVLMKWMGIGDASADCIRKTLRAGEGESVVLVVGGAEESLMAKPNTNNLLLQKRKGFVRIALQEGSPLVPVYGFGENNVYGVSPLANNPIVKAVLETVRKLTGFVMPLIVGRGFFIFNFGILPRRRPIVVVVGEPINMPKIANPTSEDLEHWHGKYVEALQKLYHAHRGVYDLESTGLRIVK